MATIAFQVIGNLALPGVGGMIGAALGSIVDNQIIFPALFGEEIQGPRLDQVRYQGGDEGSPQNFCIGNECRVGGTVIWMGPLIEKKKTRGGGFFQGPKVTTYKYYVDAAVAYNDGAVDNIPKVWRNGDLFYDDDPDITIVDDGFSLTVRILYSWDPELGTQESSRIVTIHSVNPGPDLSVLRSGVDTEISGWTNADNNGTFKCIRSGYETGGSFAEFRSFGANVAEASSPGDVTIYQDLPEFNPRDVTSITRYNGNQIIGGSPPQNPDPVIEAKEGSGNVPNWRETAYVVFERMNVTDTRGQFPQTEAMVEEGTTTVGGAIQKIIGRGDGLSASDYDVTGVSGATEKPFRGYVLSSAQESSTALRPLLLAHDILVQERNGVLYFFDRDQAEEIDIDPDDLAAHPEGSDTDRVVVIGDSDGLRLPSEVNVGYLDSERNYQEGNQRQRLRTPLTEVVSNIQLAMVFSPVEARKMALRFLWTPWANRQAVRGFLMPSYFGPGENDILNFTAQGEDWRVILTRVERGANFLRSFEGLVERASVLDFEDVIAESGEVETGQDIILPPDLVLGLADIPALTDDHAERPGLYFTQSMGDPDEEWPGGFLYESDDDTTFTDVAELSFEGEVGFALTKLDDATPGYWDDENTVDIELYDSGDGLESKTDQEVFGGQNWFYVGGEVIGAATVTSIGTRQYRLSRLLRGIRDTEHVMDEHPSGGGDLVIHLSGGVEFRELSNGDVDTDKWYKAVPEGVDEGDVSSTKIHLELRTLQCWAPCHLDGERASASSPVGGDSIRLKWFRRGRTYTDDGDMVLLEPQERYLVEIYLGTGSTVVRSVFAYVPYLWYFESQMIEDGNTPGNPVKFTVRQMSFSIGYGRSATATVG